jgi:hypothetical protein
MTPKCHGPSGRGINHRKGMRSQLATILKFERYIEAAREKRLPYRHRTGADRNRYAALRTQRAARARQLPFRCCCNFHHVSMLSSLECSDIVIALHGDQVPAYS